MPGQRAASPTRAEEDHPLLDDPEALAELVAELCTHRRERALPTRRWTRQAVRQAIVRALAAGYDRHDIVAALVAVATDPATELPGRLAAPGPWWDVPETDELRRRRQVRLEQEQALKAARAACTRCDNGWVDVHENGRDVARRCPSCYPEARSNA
jgi:hypothetical protein